MKQIFLYALCGFLLFSCVSKKVYVDLQTKYKTLKKEKSILFVKYDSLLVASNKKQTTIENLKEKAVQYVAQQNTQKEKLKNLQRAYEMLEKSYNLLSKKSAGLLAKNAKENSRLLTQLSEKQLALSKEVKRISQMKIALNERSNRIKNLEQLIAEKENALNNLKKSISDALHSFEGRGLAVTQKNGRVYISMENKLLFKPGSWRVGKEGRKAVVELSKVLVQNPDINVLIEGHTDTDPYRANATIEDNWDLSVKRATAIVRVLQKNNVNPKQITAAGRSSYLPIASNKTKVGKAKNRRIEIILSPNIDAINGLLKK